MSASSFEAALARLLAHEGGYSNHPADPGGATKYGITLADYRRYAKPDATAADMRAMGVDEAKVIYRARYWNALRCDDLPPGLDYAVFDYGVNSGTARAAKVLRRLLGLAEAGGVDAAVLAAVRGREPAQLIVALCDERLAFLQQLRTWPTFGRGWSRRVAEVRATALSMAGGKAAAQPAPASSGKTGRAAGGVIIGGGIAAGQAHAAEASPIMVAAIMLVAGVVAIALILWVRWRERRHDGALIPPPQGGGWRTAKP